MKTNVAAIDNSQADFIVGSDEAGYGAWAGPLLVVAVRVPRDWKVPAGLTDSKALTEAKREALLALLLADPLVQHKTEMKLPTAIDQVGVYRANIEAHLAAHQTFSQNPTDLHIADGNLKLPGIISLPKADALIPAVSAASIFAKVFRDHVMVKLGEKFQGYGFQVHKGYGVPTHQEALTRLGPCEAHRKSYGPVAAALRDAAPKTEPSIMDLIEELPEEEGPWLDWLRS